MLWQFMTDIDHNIVAPGERKFLFLLGSARAEGNTEALARQAAVQLPAEVEQRWLRLSDHPLPPFEDLRHSQERWFADPSGDERLLFDATVEATDLVIASPLYWYGVSASTKLYLDYWVNWLHLPDLRFKDRMRGSTMWAVTAASGGAPDALFAMLRASASYMGMRWGGELLGRGTKPGEVGEDTEAQAKAKVFF